MPARVNREARRAESRYRQVRLTYTEEISGAMSYSIYVKPLNAGWQESQCIVRDRLIGFEPAASREDVFRRLEALCKEQFLPVTHD